VREKVKIAEELDDEKFRRLTGVKKGIKW